MTRPKAGMADRLDTLIGRYLDDQRIVGAVVLVGTDTGVAYARAAGLADREARRPMTEDAIFRLASVSKPMVAATVLAMTDRGILTLDEPIIRWLPDFRPRTADGREHPITLRQLLSHTSGIGYVGLDDDDPYRKAGVSGGMEQPGLSIAENLRRIASAPLYHEPGTAWRYGAGIDVAGAVVEAATGARLGEAVRQFVTGPLGMNDTGFVVSDRARLATPYGEGVPPRRMGETHKVEGELGADLFFVPDRIFNLASFHSGGAGMAGTAGDFLKFLQAIRNGGAPILTRETLADARRNQVGSLPRPEAKDAGWRFGLLSAVLDNPAPTGSPLSRGALEWGGAYGHGWFVDFDAGVSVVAFTNTAVEGCLGQFPKDIREAVIG